MTFFFRLLQISKPRFGHKAELLFRLWAQVWSRFWSWSSGNVWCLQIFVYLRLCCSVFALPWCHSLFQRRVCVSSSSFSWFWLNFTIAFPSMWNSGFKRQSFLGQVLVMQEQICIVPNDKWLWRYSWLADPGLWKRDPLSPARYQMRSNTNLSCFEL